MKSCLSVVPLVVFGLGLCPSAYASEPSTHDGLLVRVQLGLGSLRSTSTALTAQGASANVGLAVGGMVNERLGVYGEYFDATSVGPSFEPSQPVGRFRDEDPDVQASLSGFGAGVVYYVMPTNLYVAATLGAACASLRERQVLTHRSRFGPALVASVGREWWLDPEWGLGLAAVAHVARLPDQGGGPTQQIGAFQLALTATFN